MNKNVLHQSSDIATKATKFEKNIPLYFGLKLLTGVKTKWVIFSHICGLLRIFELYLGNMINFRLVSTNAIFLSSIEKGKHFVLYRTDNHLKDEK